MSTACVGYRAGSFERTDGAFSGSRYTVGCLDIAVKTVSEPGATGPVAALTFGNRCDVATTVDLPAIAATGRFADGHVEELSVYDPRDELRAATLDAGATARELLEYQGEPVSAVDLAIAQIRGEQAMSVDPADPADAQDAPDPNANANADALDHADQAAYAAQKAAHERTTRVVELCLDLTRIDADEPAPRAVVACMSVPRY